MVAICGVAWCEQWASMAFTSFNSLPTDLMWLLRVRIWPRAPWMGSLAHIWASLRMELAITCLWEGSAPRINLSKLAIPKNLLALSISLNLLMGKYWPNSQLRSWRLCWYLHNPHGTFLCSLIVLQRNADAYADNYEYEYEWMLFCYAFC